MDSRRWFKINRTSPIVEEDSTRTTSFAGTFPLFQVIAITLLLAVGITALSLIIVTAVPAMRTNISGASWELSPETPVSISVSNLGTGVADIRLKEGTRGPDGKLASEEAIPVILVPDSKGSAPSLTSELQLARRDGSPLLRYDRLYHLQVTTSSIEAAFPLPRTELTTQDFTFSTLTAPKVLVPSGTIQLGYQKPLEIKWSSPIDGFNVKIVPAVDLYTWVDQTRGDVGYVDLAGALPGTTYQVSVVDARGANGAPLQSTATFMVATAPIPRPALDRVKFEDGTRITIPFDNPIQSMQYAISPEVQSTLSIDPSDSRSARISLADPKLSQEYQITILGGVGASGTPIDANQQFSVTTPSPLAITKFRPKDSSIGVALDSPITITFGQPVKDRAAAETAIKLDPAVPGRFEWTDANTVQFTSEGRLPELTDMVVRIEGGAKGVRDTSGGYLEKSEEFTFRTAPNKRIDVDLTRQKLVLFENDVPIFSTLVATGVRGAETPTGDFTVLYKMEKTRMQGVNPSGHRYDLPDVPWVMPFFEDYALHGAYWRETYGTPQSNGCVSMPTSAAKTLFDLSPEGTPVHIHY